MKEPFATISIKRGIDELVKKNVARPQPIRKRKNRLQKATFEERQEAAACFEEIPPEETFAWHLWYDSAKETPEFEERLENGKSVPAMLKNYTKVLLQIEREIYAYCDQRDIGKRVKTERFLLEAIERIFDYNVLFGKSKLSLDVQSMYNVVHQQIKEQKNGIATDKEQISLILYNYLVLAQNAIMAESENRPIALLSMSLDLPFIFEKLEKRLCLKSTLEKQYQTAKKYLSEKKTGTAKKQADDIVLYHSFAYVRMASIFVYEYVKLLGML